MIISSDVRSEKDKDYILTYSCSNNDCDFYNHGYCVNLMNYPSSIYPYGKINKEYSPKRDRNSEECDH